VPYLLVNNVYGKHFQAIYKMNEAAFKVLLVEDNNERVDLARNALVPDKTCPEYEIVVVAELDEALAVVEGGELDLILLGIRAPSADTLEITKSLRSRSPDMPIVVLTQEYDRAFATQAIQSGARDCLGGEEVIVPLLQRVARHSIERYRIQRRLDDLRTKKERENEMARLGTLCGPSNLTATLRSLSSTPLKEARPSEFSAETEIYGSLLNRLLEADTEDEKSIVREELHDLADRLGDLNTGPRDLVEIHKSAVSRKLQSRFVTDSNAAIEEGRLLLLQLMGHLVSYYRRLSWGRRVPRAQNRVPSKQTVSRPGAKD